MWHWCIIGDLELITNAFNPCKKKLESKVYRKVMLGARGSSVLGAFAEDPGSHGSRIAWIQDHMGSSTHMKQLTAICNSRWRVPSDLQWYLHAYGAHTYTPARGTHIYTQAHAHIHAIKVNILNSKTKHMAKRNKTFQIKKISPGLWY